MEKVTKSLVIEGLAFARSGEKLSGAQPSGNSARLALEYTRATKRRVRLEPQSFPRNAISDPKEPEYLLTGGSGICASAD